PVVHAGALAGGPGDPHKGKKTSSDAHPPRQQSEALHTRWGGGHDTSPRHQARRLNRGGRAPNSLSVGQISLLDNPLLTEPLKIEHVKPRLLGHWGTTPGLNFIYVHLNRMIKAHDLNVVYVCGPGHAGPALVANTYMEGTYNELYPNITEDAEG